MGILCLRKPQTKMSDKIGTYKVEKQISRCGVCKNISLKL